jgi:hypothetical protein
MSHLSGFARFLHLPAGLQAITVEGRPALQAPSDGLSLPMTRFVSDPAKGSNRVKFVLSSDEAGEWLPPAGGTAVARVPPGGGDVIVVTYGVATEAELPALRVLQLAASEEARAPGLDASADLTREFEIEVTVHVEGEGDRRAPAHGWVGTVTERQQIEGFGLRPLDGLAPSDIEYMGFGLGGRRTAWITDSRLCGTRGRGLPLTGFAVRVAPALRERLTVVYEGAFFASGIIGPARDGEPCVPLVPDDPLRAIRLRVIERPRA